MPRSSLVTMVSVSRDELGLCDEWRPVLEHCDTIADAYLSARADQLTWWLDTFVNDAAQLRRMRASLRAVERHEVRRAAREQRPPDWSAVGELQRALVLAWFPNADEIVHEATRAPAARAKAQLLKHIPEVSEWRTRTAS